MGSQKPCKVKNTKASNFCNGIMAGMRDVIRYRPHCIAERNKATRERKLLTDKKAGSGITS